MAIIGTKDKGYKNTKTGQYYATREEARAGGVGSPTGVSSPKGGTQPTWTPSGQTFSYIDTSGKMQTINAADEATAFASATNIAPTSGVIRNPLQTPSTTSSSPRITSSSDPIVTNNKKKGVQSGADNLAGAFGNDPVAMWYQQFSDKQIKDYTSYADSLKDLVGRKTDLALARSNQQYNTLMQKLDKEYKTSIDVAKAQAAAINPYGSQSTSEMQYADTLSKNYTDAAEDLTNQARMAQEALELGEIEAYIQIQKGMQDSYNQMTQNLYTALTDLSAQKTQAEQFEMTMNEKQSDNFLNYITKVPMPTPAEIDKMDINALLQNPVAQVGLKAGYTLEGVKEMMKQGSFAQQKLDLQQQQLINAQNRSTATQLRIASMQGVASTQQSLLAAGYKPGTFEYAAGLASATGQSPSFLSTTEKDTYTNMSLLSSSLSSFKDNIQKINESSSAWNIINQYAGKPISSMSDANLAELNASMQAMAGIYGKSVFAESGNLSNGDIGRILNSLPTSASSAELRNALYNNMVGVLSEKANMTLQSDAANGKNVSAFVPIVKQINDVASMSKIETAPTGSQDMNTWFNNLFK